LLDGGMAFSNQDGLLRFDEDTTVSPLLSVYAPWVGSEGEELLASKSDAAGLGGIGVLKRGDDCLLLLEAEIVP